MCWRSTYSWSGGEEKREKKRERERDMRHKKPEREIDTESREIVCEEKSSTHASLYLDPLFAVMVKKC